MAQAIHEEIRFDASPARVYSALTDAREFAAFTGAPADIQPEAGGAFSGFGGHVVGSNVELDPGRRVVQAWRAASWTPGVYSIVRFELTGQSGSTALVFDQAGFPDNEAAHLAQGWHRMYWEPLRRYLGASP
jgi:uncharacterized protein YndB with AHSA1/START domain